MSVKVDLQKKCFNDKTRLTTSIWSIEAQKIKRWLENKQIGNKLTLIMNANKSDDSSGIISYAYNIIMQLSYMHLYMPLHAFRATRI